MKTFYIEAHGCSRRMLDGKRIKEYMGANGWRRVSDPARAACVIIVTCALTQTMTEECFERIGCLVKYKGRMIVYGCLPAMFPARLKAIFAGDVLVTRDIDEIDSFFPDFLVKFAMVADANFTLVRPVAGLTLRRKARRFCAHQVLRLKKIMEYWVSEWSAPWPLVDRARKIVSDIFRARRGLVEGVMGGVGFNPSYASLRVSEGCLGQCSYCGIKKAIGKTKSKPLVDVRGELERLVAMRRFRLNVCSSDLGAYGVDIGTDLIALLRFILNVDKRFTLAFLQDLNPSWVCRYKEALVDLIGSKRIESVLMPVQSGSGRILGLMRRDFSLDEFKRVVQDMKKRNPSLKVKTQVIVGFPTESEADFEMTVGYLKACAFDQVDAFAYYEVDGTEARTIVPKVPAAVIKKRLRALVQLLPPQTIKAVAY